MTAAASRLLSWYDRARRDLPWRAPPGRRQEPYRVWLSEIMLQQTTVAAVIPFYRRFLARWPDLAALAAAPLEAVLNEWAGLGYYARARNLHACARQVRSDLGGRFPETETALRELPGIGRYTAAAVAAIAFERAAVPVDANVERVLARRFGVRVPLPRAKAALRAHAGELAPDSRHGDFAQALMELGALVCTPKRPDCGRCPWSADCAARAKGDAESLPRKPPKRARPLRHGHVFVLRRPRDGALLLRRRPAKGLLGGMMEFPGSPWQEARIGRAAALAHAPAKARWRALAEPVSHGFTHFELALTVWLASGDGADGRWVRPRDLARAGLPSLMKKVARAAQRIKGEREPRT
ncbi:MAG: A/G-specific adenine glycosylase [Alphaproteobacteria bacterium]|nr:A/G-specific adenine glycosylase [Alphaproteobacteria bacterium]